MNAKKEVAFKDDILSKESLPYPFVYYPGFYGAFFSFKQKTDGKFYFCSCSKKAIENYIRLRISRPIPINIRKERKFILDSMYFPISFIRNLMELKITSDLSIMNHLNFKKKICHECNKILPYYKYCVPMYGSVFKQNYGWYINKQAFEFGINPINYYYLKDQLPNEIKELLILDPEETERNLIELSPRDVSTAEKIKREYNKQKRQVDTIIENVVREKLGYKKIGDEWLNETILYEMLNSLMPDRKIKRHFRPDFLEKLELDIFIPELKIGIEYQGIRHFKPVEHWGGVEGLKKVQERDAKKIRLCKMNGIRLVYFYYYEDITESLICKKIGL